MGVSTNRNYKAAGKEAARKALDAAESERPDFVFMFATVGYPQKDILNAVSNLLVIKMQKDAVLIAFHFCLDAISHLSDQKTRESRQRRVVPQQFLF